MRARNLKPSFFKNEDLVELPFEARLLFAGLWCLADREGRLEDRPKHIKFEVFPGDDCSVDALLDALAAKGLIVRYKVDGGAYIAIPKFPDHQKPHSRELPSTIPEPPKAQPRRCPGTTQAKPSPASRARALNSPSPFPLPESPLLNAGGTPAPALVDNELLDELLDTAASIKSSAAEWAPTKADRATFSALVVRFPAEQLRQELGKFAAYAPQRDWRLFGKAFASWMGRVTPLPMTAARPTARALRIANARAQLEGGADDATAHAMVLDDLEWQEVLRQIGRPID